MIPFPKITPSPQWLSGPFDKTKASLDLLILASEGKRTLEYKLHSYPISEHGVPYTIGSLATRWSVSWKTVVSIIDSIDWVRLEMVKGCGKQIIYPVVEVSKIIEDQNNLQVTSTQPQHNSSIISNTYNDPVQVTSTQPQHNVQEIGRASWRERV